MYGLNIPTIGFVSLHAYACPNVNYEVSALVGQFYVAVYTGGVQHRLTANDASTCEWH